MYCCDETTHAPQKSAAEREQQLEPIYHAGGLHVVCVPEAARREEGRLPQLLRGLERNQGQPTACTAHSPVACHSAKSRTDVHITAIYRETNSGTGKLRVNSVKSSEWEFVLTTIRYAFLLVATRAHIALRTTGCTRSAV